MFTLISFLGTQYGIYIQENLNVNKEKCCFNSDMEHSYADENSKHQEAENCCDTDCQDCVFSSSKISWGLYSLSEKLGRDYLFFIPHKKRYYYHFFLLPNRDFNIWKPPKIGSFFSILY